MYNIGKVLHELCIPVENKNNHKKEKTLVLGQFKSPKHVCNFFFKLLFHICVLL